MPWEEVTVMDQKKRFIEANQTFMGSFKELCTSFGISRKTGYKYLRKYQENGLAGLKENSRRPKTSPNKTSVNIEEIVIQVRLSHPAWSGEKISRYLQNKGYINLPTEKTMNRIIKRHGLITTEESEKHTPWKRFEHEHPNDLWQMDFKGHFGIETGRCHPLTLLDDHSRFSLLLKACDNEREITVKQALTDTFLEYGLPLRMTMDNGAPWGTSHTIRHTTLTAWLIRLGIFVTYSRPRHPQTQGKLERFHRTLKTELLSRFIFKNLEETQRGFNWWRKIYNEERPHAAINHAVPLNRYQHSIRSFPKTLPDIEYSNDMIVKRVQRNGEMSHKGKLYRIGAAFGGQPIGLKETLDEDIYEVYFCSQLVAMIDLKNPI